MRKRAVSRIRSGVRAGPLTDLTLVLQLCCGLDLRYAKVLGTLYGRQAVEAMGFCRVCALSELCGGLMASF